MREFRATCECGYRSEWLNKRYCASAEIDVHLNKDECVGATKAIQSRKKKSCVPGFPGLSD